MANTNMSLGDVKSVCNELECSPSKHDSSGSYGGKPKITVGGTAAAGPDQTDEFKMVRNAGKIPGYKGRFAKKAAQS